MTKVAIHEFLGSDGTQLGCGTALEMEHWKAEGVFADGDKLGRILGYEDARADELRKAAWAKDKARIPELLA